MWSRFGKVYLLAGDRTAKRRASVMRELERVGIAQLPQFVMLRGSFASGHDAHFRALQDFANDRRCGGTCLILEDDIRFLRDLAAVERIVKGAPPADIVLFDSFMHLPPELLGKRGKAPFMYWTNGIYGTSCYSVSKVASLVLALSYARHTKEPPDSHMFLGHQDLCTVVSSENACVQLTYLESDNVRKYGVDSQHHYYRAMGIDYSKYAVPEGFGYGRAIAPNGEVA